MKSIFRFTLAALLLLPVAQPASARDAKLKIVTTLNYLRYIAQEIGGENVTATALANPRQDPHYVTATPSMNQLCSEADLFIQNGLSLDIWQKNVVEASGNPKIQPGARGHLIATVNIPVKELPTEVSRAWGDIHPQGNPHVWLDPLNVRIVARNIADRLKLLDPDNASYYQARLEQYTYTLDAAMFGEQLLKALGKTGGDILVRKTMNNELDDWLKLRQLETKLGGWMKQSEPLRGVKVISYHKTYVYFADRFGLTIAGELEEKPGIPPPPQHRDAMVEQVKREGIKVILNDNFYSREAADYIASKTGARVLTTYIDVGAAPEIDTYQKLITFLIEDILQAIR